VQRRIPVPPRPGWPVEIELSTDGPAVARFAGGREQSFVLESDLLRTFGMTWGELRRWAQVGAEGDELKGGWSSGEG